MLNPFRRSLRSSVTFTCSLLAGTLLLSAAEHPSFEAFKKHISTPVTAFDIEFDDGDVRHPPHHKTELNKKGQLVSFVPSVNRFTATWQSDGFVIRRAPDVIPVPNLPKGQTEFALRMSGGYSGTRAWWKTDNGAIQMVELDPEVMGNPGSIYARVRDYQNRTWGAWMFGLPRLDTSTLVWEADSFHARTESGALLSAVCSLEPQSGALTKLVYEADTASIQQATLEYEYDTNANVYPLPSIFKRTVQRADHPLTAAKGATTVQVKRLVPKLATYESAQFLPTADEFRTNSVILHSNKFVYTKSGGKFVLIPPGASRYTDALEAETRLKKRILQAAFLAVLLTPIIGVIVRRRNHKTSNNTQPKGA